MMEAEGLFLGIYQCIFIVGYVTAGHITEDVPRYEDFQVIGYISSPLIDEASGLAASRRHKDVLYTMNDSGDLPRIFAISATNASLLAVIDIEGATNCDWESMTIGPAPGDATSSFIYIGDTGGNTKSKCEVIYRVEEPSTIENTTLSISAVVNYTWPERDCETLYVDKRGQLHLVSKVGVNETPKMYIVPKNAWGAPGSVKPVNLTHGKTIWIKHKGIYGGPVAGDISVDNNDILLKTYEEIFYWRHTEDADLWQTLSHPGKPVPYQSEPQGETVAWHPDGSGYYTLSEREFQPLYFYAKITGSAAPFTSCCCVLYLITLVTLCVITI